MTGHDQHAPVAYSLYAPLSYYTCLVNHYEACGILPRLLTTRRIHLAHRPHL